MKSITYACNCKLPSPGEYIGNGDAYECTFCGGYISGLELKRRVEKALRAKKKQKAIDSLQMAKY